MARSEAQKRADKKYAAKKYSSKTVRLDKEYNEKVFIPYIKKLEMSENGFIVKSIKYCIDNNIDLSVTEKGSSSENVKDNRD